MEIIILIVLSLINLMAFIFVGLDKSKSIAQQERIPEVFFFVWAVCFTSLGVLLGMFFFHHKTRKWYFPFGIFLLFLEQAGLLYMVNHIFAK